MDMFVIVMLMLFFMFLMMFGCASIHVYIVSIVKYKATMLKEPTMTSLFLGILSVVLSIFVLVMTTIKYIL